MKLTITTEVDSLEIAKRLLIADRDGIFSDIDSSLEAVESFVIWVFANKKSDVCLSLNLCFMPVVGALFEEFKATN